MTVALAVLLSLVAAPPPPDNGSVSVAGFNVLFEGADNQKNLQAIEEMDADLVCLTELTPAFAKELGRTLKARYPHQALYPKPGTWGVGILSRFPLAAVSTFPQLPHQMPAVRARATVAAGAHVTVACVHLFPPGAKRSPSDNLMETNAKNAQLRVDQSRGLVQRFKDIKDPLIVVGDFNEAQSGDAVSVLTAAGFAAACDAPVQSCSATWPGATSAFPAVVQIDHILGRGVVFSSAATVKAGGSDHFPVLASFSTSPAGGK